jgi:hypothetical protein
VKEKYKKVKLVYISSSQTLAYVMKQRMMYLVRERGEWGGAGGRGRYRI